MTLERVERLPDGEIRAVLLAHPSKGKRLVPVKIGRTSILGSADVKRRWLERKTDGSVEFDITFQLPDGEDRFSLTQQLHYSPPGRKVVFKFRNVNPRSLPVRVKSGDLEAVLREVHANKSVASNKNRTSGNYRWIAKCLRGGSPKGKLFYGIVVEVPTVGGVRHIWKCELTDEMGRSNSVFDDYNDRFRHMKDLRRELGDADEPTLVENVVSKVSPDKAASMYDRRTTEADRNASARIESELRLFAFPEMDPKPKRLTLGLTATVPTPGGDTIAFSFDHVQVP